MQIPCRHILSSLYLSTLFVGSDYLITGYFSLLNTVLLLTLVLFLNRTLLFILAVLGLIHQLFFSYFQRELHTADIYNFFTHIGETFETLIPFIMIAYKPLLFFIIILLSIMIMPKTPKVKYTYSLIFILLPVNLHSTLGLKIIPALWGLTSDKPHAIMIEQTPLYPTRKTDADIILIIAESMKHNTYTTAKFQALSGFHKKIYAAATNTDVSIPLLLNAKENPLTLTTNDETNLFRLAHKNGYKNTFVSLQSEKSLRYIKPYLQTAYIHTYKSHNKKEREPKFDFFILDALHNIDSQDKQFIVFQQIGQHSPYHYFQGVKSSSPKENYTRSLDDSFALYKAIYTHLQKRQKPFIMIVTSDHGEFTGENGRWGHNSFEKTIYEVPLFITSNIPLPDATQDIASHYHLAQYITFLLGYHDTLTLKEGKSTINGTMLNREDGFILRP